MIGESPTFNPLSSKQTYDTSAAIKAVIKTALRLLIAPIVTKATKSFTLLFKSLKVVKHYNSG